jgi:hypothetical protein
LTRRKLKALTAVVLLVTIIAVFGPREPFDETITFNASALSSDLDTYLSVQQSKAPNLTTGAAKHIVWNDPALIMLHKGDSVVRADLRQAFAERWGANTDASATVYEVKDAQDANNHVIAVRILSPDNSKPLADKAIKWINAL